MNDMYIYIYRDIFQKSPKNKLCPLAVGIPLHSSSKDYSLFGQVDNVLRFKVTLVSLSWRSLNHWKGHSNIPKRSQTIVKHLFYIQSKLWHTQQVDIDTQKKWLDKCIFSFKYGVLRPSNSVPSRGWSLVALGNDDVILVVTIACWLGSDDHLELQFIPHTWNLPKSYSQSRILPCEYYLYTSSYAFATHC